MCHINYIAIVSEISVLIRTALGGLWAKNTKYTKEIPKTQPEPYVCQPLVAYAKPM